jgi:RimJ/RimL family protein N-acetyltransferase
MKAPTLITNRLILRAITPDDFEPYAAMWLDPRVTNFIGGSPRPRDESWRRFCQSVGLWDLFGYGYWLFTLSSTGAMIGVGGLAQFERGMPQLVGFPEAGWAFSADHWGQGYASEAVGAVMHWADGAIAHPEIRCIIAPKNTPSIRVAEKNGFTQIDETENDLGVSKIFARASMGKVSARDLESSR